jgi:SAM-dependent methyltransferase
MRPFPNPRKAKARLLEEFSNKRILDLNNFQKSFSQSKQSQASSSTEEPAFRDIHSLPWPIKDNSFDLVICQNILAYAPNTAKTLEELNRITSPGGKIYIETPHYTCFDAHRNNDNCHKFSHGSFDYFLKGNSYYNTDFLLEEKYLFFDDLSFLLGIGFIANLFPRFYETRLSFIFPATSLQITVCVDKS